MSNSLTSDFLMMSLRRNMWGHDSIYTSEGKDRFLETGVTEKSD